MFVVSALEAFPLFHCYHHAPNLFAGFPWNCFQSLQNKIIQLTLNTWHILYARYYSWCWGWKMSKTQFLPSVGFYSTGRDRIHKHHSTASSPYFRTEFLTLSHIWRFTCNLDSHGTEMCTENGWPRTSTGTDTTEVSEKWLLKEYKQ